MTQLNRAVVAAFIAIFIALPAAAVLTTTERRMFTSVSEDIEPTLVSQVRFGVEYNTIAWMKLNNNQNSTTPSRLHFSSVNSNGATAAGAIGQLSGFTNGRYADPWLTQNKLTTGSAPQRIYLVGVVHSGAFTQPSAVARWYSDNGGFSWSSAAAVISDPGAYFYDKTTADVSAHSGSPGYLYVSFIRRNSNGQHEPMVMVSVNGGASFAGPFQVAAPAGSYGTPQVMVDSSNGQVYVVWKETSEERFLVARAPAYNGTLVFGDPVTLTRDEFIQDGTHYAQVSPTVSVRASTVPIARLDAVNRRIGVAWHEEYFPNPGQSNPRLTVIRFTTIDIRNGNLAWRSPAVIIAAGGTHDIQPAMDFDSAGNYMIAYYSFQSGTNGYWHVGTYVTCGPDGYVTHESPSLLRGTLSDLSLYVPQTSTDRRLLGEYHTTVYSNGSFKTVQIVISGQGDPYLFTSTH